MYPISLRPRALVAAAGSAAAAIAVSAGVALAAATIHTGRACYVLGQSVQLRGSGFAPSTPYTVMLDGVFLGGSPKTDAQGNVSVHFGAGGLPAGFAQHTDRVTVNDGTGDKASTYFTLTRPPLARLTETRTTSGGLTGRIKVWGFSRNGSAREVYVHYVSPTGRHNANLPLGQTHGACGWVVSKRELFVPTSLSRGTWTLQVDTHRSYSRKPSGPVSRIRLTIH